MGFRLDPIVFECLGFKQDLDDLVYETYSHSFVRLREILEETLRRCERDIGAARDEYESGVAYQVRDWEDERGRERERVLGGLAICYMVAMLEATLRRLKGYFDKSHPPAGNYLGKSLFMKTVAEYEARFKLDFTSAPVKLTDIEELVLARNCILHNEGVPDPQFRGKFPRSRYIDAGHVDEEDRIRFSDELVRNAIAQSKLWVHWLTDELIRFRDSGRTPAAQ